ncbi:MAG: hypothetical protein Q4P06_08570 [Actinomycetaceae bacterium]|nr:hypothetical protein [Actinomycetaceae bacterium]
MSDKDFSGYAFARILTQLPAHTPLYDDLGGGAQDGDDNGVWYRDQREHLIGWFSELAGPGAYNRKSRGLKARHGYNHFQCAEGLLWLAEALGEDPQVVRAAYEAVSEHTHTAARSAAVRRLIPWERVVELIIEKGLHNPPRHRW